MKKLEENKAERAALNREELGLDKYQKELELEIALKEAYETDRPLHNWVHGR